MYPLDLQYVANIHLIMFSIIKFNGQESSEPLMNSELVHKLCEVIQVDFLMHLLP